MAPGFQHRAALLATTIMGVVLSATSCGQEKPLNRPPLFVLQDGLRADQPYVQINQRVSLRAPATDADGDKLKFQWNVHGGGDFATTAGAEAQYLAPAFATTAQFEVFVLDGEGGVASAALQLPVVESTAPTLCFLQPANNCDGNVPLDPFPIENAISTVQVRPEAILGMGSLSVSLDDVSLAGISSEQDSADVDFSALQIEYGSHVLKARLVDRNNQAVESLLNVTCCPEGP